jgi:hypothetical protein
MPHPLEAIRAGDDRGSGALLFFIGGRRCALLAQEARTNLPAGSSSEEDDALSSEVPSLQAEAPPLSQPAPFPLLVVEDVAVREINGDLGWGRRPVQNK